MTTAKKAAPAKKAAAKKAAAAPKPAAPSGTSEPIKLGKFDGLDVLAAGIEVRNVSGGLNEAVAVDPIELHKDDEVTVVMRVKVTDINHKALKDVNGWRRVHITRAMQATIVDDDFAADLLEAQAQRIEEAQGVKRLQFDAAELDAAHWRGEHEDAIASGEFVDGCKECEIKRAEAQS